MYWIIGAIVTVALVLFVRGICATYAQVMAAIERMRKW